MFLEAIAYSQFENTPRVWTLEGCTLGNINLIVGRNATGKSRTLSIIRGLADLLSGEHKLTYLSGNYEVAFDNNGKKIRYALKYEDRRIIKESLDIDSANRINRGLDGAGEIYYEERKDTIKFQTPDNELASLARRDSIQHSFLENLYEWGKSVRLYLFGTQLGQDQLAIFIKDKERAEQQKLNLKDQGKVVAIFRKGEKEFGVRFTDPIRQDMGSIGYELNEIGTAIPADFVVDSNILIPGEIVGLYVQESDLSGKTYQNEMSQGMFRALSLIIQITYSQLAGVPSCILIDDIGEGLDYERSSALIKLLIERAKETSVQLIMATNDRFVMNNVPLEYWSVIQRIGGISRIYNYRNSPKLFDDFALTGLNNFDFFSSNYYLKDISEN
jgi:energy-coupling factor transporter ATP-binding protein EcfA2